MLQRCGCTVWNPGLKKDDSDHVCLLQLQLQAVELHEAERTAAVERQLAVQSAKNQAHTNVLRTLSHDLKGAFTPCF